MSSRLPVVFSLHPQGCLLHGATCKEVPWSVQVRSKLGHEANGFLLNDRPSIGGTKGIEAEIAMFTK